MSQLINDELLNFINFSFEKLIPSYIPITDQEIIAKAFNDTILDCRYHHPDDDKLSIKNHILRNTGWLPVFLYRLARVMNESNYSDQSKYQLHFVMKVLCMCEIYWSSEIGVGLRIDHGLGTVIGSRSKIGKGLLIHHGCTIGHKEIYKLVEGPRIGDDVVLCANSQILGNITVGDKTIISANSLLLDSTDGNEIVAGNPAKRIKRR